MRAAVLGTGEVGTAIAGKLKSLGNDVVLGSRYPGASQGGIEVLNHANAAAHGEWIFNAMHGEAAVEVLGNLHLGAKVLVDMGNFQSAIDGPLNATLGETQQAMLPETRVIKAMNFPSAHLMVDPGHLSEHHSVFIAGNDALAKGEVGSLLQDFGWRDVVDLGDLTACRAMESLAPMWIRLNQYFDHVWFNLAVVRASSVGD